MSLIPTLAGGEGHVGLTYSDASFAFWCEVKMVPQSLPKKKSNIRTTTIQELYVTLP